MSTTAGNGPPPSGSLSSPVRPTPRSARCRRDASTRSSVPRVLNVRRPVASLPSAPEPESRDLGLARAEAEERGLALGAGLALAGGDVDRHAQVHGRRAGMAGGAPRLAIRRQVRLEIGDVEGAQAEEDPEAEPAGDRERL